MNQSAALYVQSLLSFASYANLQKGMTSADVADALKQAKMSPAQAADFASNWTVVATYADASGVAATVFQDATGKRYLAIRGTTPTAGDLNADYILAVGFPSYLNPQFVRLQAQVDTWLGDGTLPAGSTVTGHSLGGYLAAAVGTWNSGHLGETYTYNAPGIGGITGNVFDAFRDALGLSNTALVSGITNVRGTAGASLISGIGAQLAPPLFVETEESLSPLQNHGIAGLTDSLAVYDLFSKADSSLSLGDMTALLKASANVSKDTLENAVSALGEVLVSGFHSRAGRNVYDTNRDALHQDIQSIDDALSQGGVTIDLLGRVASDGTFAPMSASEIKSLARNNIAHRYALVHGNAFAVVGADYSSANRAGELESYDPATGRGQLTNDYLADRSAYLSKLLYSNAYDTTDTGSDVEYVDLGKNVTLNALLPSNRSTRVVFGTDGADEVDGTRSASGEEDVEDRLYGMSGDDVLRGFGGADYLEGGVGIDALDGGSGDDTLIGGKGNDRLYGGTGNDTYLFHPGDGHDEIRDPDGEGVIRIGGEEFGGTDTNVFLQNGNAVWESADGRYEYRLLDGDLASGGTLAISGSGLGSGDAITVRDFKNGDLGVTLNDQPRIDILEDSLSNPFTSADYQPATASTTLEEGGARQLTVALSRPARAGERIRLTLDGPSAGEFAAVLGEEAHSFSGGALELELTPGQNRLPLSLLETGNVDADAALTLSAAFVDGQGNTSGDSAGLTVNLHAHSGEDSDPQPTNTIVGDYRWRDVDLTQPGLQDSRGTLGNRNYAEPLQEAPGQEDVLLGGPEPDALYGRGGRDVLYAWHGFDPDTLKEPSKDHLHGGEGGDLLIAFAGNDIAEGGEGADLIIDDYDADGAYDGGNDRFYGDAEVSLASALAAGNTATGTGAKGDFIATGDGEDLAVGSAGNDLISGGSGADMLLGGAGRDFIYGDTNWVPDVGPPRLQDWGAALDPTEISQWNLDGFDWSAQLDVTGGAAGQEYEVTVTHATSTEAAAPGDDLIYAGAGDDFVNGEGGDDVLLGERGDDVLFGDEGNDTLLGGAGDDALMGDNDNLATAVQGEDFLDGGEGNDRLLGGARTDVLYGGAGDDRLVGDARDSQAGDDYLNGEAGDDVLLGAAGNDTLYGGAGADELYGDASNVAPEKQGGDILDGGSGDDTIVGGGGTDALSGGDGADALYGDAGGLDAEYQGDDRLDGGAGDDLLVGGGAADSLLGGDGADTLDGDAGGLSGSAYGNDYLDGGAGADVLIGNGGADVLVGGAGGDELYGDASDVDPAYRGDDLLYGGGGDDVLVGDGGSDVLMGGAGADELYGDASDVDSAYQGDDLLEGGSGNDTLVGFGGADSLLGGVGDDLLSGDGGADILDGGADDDVLFGGAGDDTLNGGAGSDVLSGGAGSDVLAGGEGLDLYRYDPGEDLVRITDSGSNTLRFGAGFSVGDLHLGLGSLKIGFDGGAGAVHIEGFDPLNPYQDSGIDRFEFADGTVLNYEQLIDLGFDFTGSAGDDVLYGTNAVDRLHGLAGDDHLIGRDGGDVLDGGSGADTLEGQAGDDRYVVDDHGDQVIEQAGAGEDRVETSIDYTLGDHVENLTLTGAAAHGTGNALDNELTGNAGSDLLEGLAGADVLDGGDGADQLYGGTGADTLVGGSGDDLLDGGAGVDRLSGGAGDDTYRVDDSGDVVAEEAGEGHDTVQSTVSYTLQDSRLEYWQIGGSVVPVQVANEVEDLRLIGPDAVYGSGNRYANRIEGNAQENWLSGDGGDDVLRGAGGDDHLDGGAGADRLAGESGDDTYVVDALDTVVEAVDEGSDTVMSGHSYTLGANLERLVLTGGDIDGTGNALDNELLGSSGDNVLDGGAGADALRGGGGDDTYLIDDAGDAVIETASAGTDRVLSFVDHTLAGNVENLTLSGAAAVEGRGNALANEVRGNVRDNALYGAAGDDHLFGGEGADMLDGGDGTDYLDGGAGADRLRGGGGNDTYIVDDTSDITLEQPGGGYDRAYSTVNYTLGEALEDLHLSGYDDIEGTGNDQDNGLYGNSGDNVLRGGSGDDYLNGAGSADRMVGGAGDDRYVVHSLQDQVVESANGGTDTVQSRVTLTLADNVENLELTGDAWIDGTGNTLDNRLVGNDRANVLAGRGGDDWADGAAGSDALFGNDGDDYLYGGDDAVGYGYGEYGYYGDGEYGYYGGGEFPRLFLAPNNDYLDGGAGDDTLDGGSGDDVLWGRAGDDYLYGGDDGWAGAPDYNGDRPAYEGDPIASEYPPVYGGSTNNDELHGGAGDDVAYGGTGNDAIYGEAGADFLSGDSGGDYLDGGTGIDEMHGGSGDDVYYVDGYREIIQNPGDGEGDDIGDTGGDVGAEETGCSGHRKGNEGVGNGEDPPPPGHETNWNDGPGTSPGHPGSRGGAHAGTPLGSAPESGHGGGSSLPSDGCGGEADECAEFGDFGVTAGGDDTSDQTRVIWHADTVVETAWGGWDAVYSSATFELPEFVENLTLISTQAIDATGNDADNRVAGNDATNRLNGGDGNDVLTGNGGDDTLDGGSGADRMQGGTGNDTYVVDTAGDIVREFADEGVDTVRSAFDYTLGDHVENLTLTAVSGAIGIGNGVANRLEGAIGADTLVGLDDDDWLLGGGGDDLLNGGAGDDTYAYGLGDGLDRIEDTSGTNTLRFKGVLGRDNVVARRTTDEGVTTAHVRLVDDYGNEMPDQGVDFTLGADGTAPVSRFEFGDGASATLEDLWAVVQQDDGTRHRDVLASAQDDDLFDLGRGNDLVHAGGGRDAAHGGQGNDGLYGEAGDDRLFGETGRDTLEGGTGFDALFGGDGSDRLNDGCQNDLLLGGAGDDGLSGGQGNDLLAGGAGDDEIELDAGHDVVLHNAGEGLDRVVTEGAAQYTVSIGGDFSLEGLNLSRDRDDLVLDLGEDSDVADRGRGRRWRDTVVFQDWFGRTDADASQVTLQLVTEASAEFDASSADPLLSTPAQRFDLNVLTDAFQASGKDRWSLTDGLLDTHLHEGAGLLGGELAHRYALDGGLGEPGASELVAALTDPRLGQRPQTVSGTLA